MKVGICSRLLVAGVAAALGLSAVASGQQRHAPDWTSLEPEILRHFQALVRFDTSDPPGAEKPASDYLSQALDKEGIPVQTFTLEPNRPNVVARLKGNGSKRPLLLMGHTDVVNVDPKKWTHPPFSAARDGGYIYGRGTLDDKDSVTTGLMVMLLLKRLNVPLDRDVIFLAEAGEEGSTRVGIQFMVNQHFAQIEAEYCLAETGGMVSFGLGQGFKPVGDFGETLLSRYLCHARVHFRIFRRFSRNGGFQVFHRRSNRQPRDRIAYFPQVVQVPVRVAGFALGRVAKQPGDFRIALDIRQTGEVEISPVGLALAGERIL